MNVNKVQVGDLIGLTYYVVVEQVLQDGLKVKDVQNNQEFMINGKELVGLGFSADRYDREERLPKTELAQKLVSAGDLPFTVEFIKQDGLTRTLRGRLVGTEHLLGRSYVMDLDITDANNIRLVDHRTIQKLIISDVMYFV